VWNCFVASGEKATLLKCSRGSENVEWMDWVAFRILWIDCDGTKEQIVLKTMWLCDGKQTVEVTEESDEDIKRVHEEVAS
jgi:hypothetical protein